jgi:hypothetical protein
MHTTLRLLAVDSALYVCVCFGRTCVLPAPFLFSSLHLCAPHSCVSHVTVSLFRMVAFQPNLFCKFIINDREVVVKGEFGEDPSPTVVKCLFPGSDDDDDVPMDIQLDGVWLNTGLKYDTDDCDFPWWAILLIILAALLLLLLLGCRCCSMCCCTRWQYMVPCISPPVCVYLGVRTHYLWIVLLWKFCTRRQPQTFKGSAGDQVGIRWWSHTRSHTHNTHTHTTHNTHTTHTHTHNTQHTTHTHTHTHTHNTHTNTQTTRMQTHGKTNPTPRTTPPVHT